MQIIIIYSRTHTLSKCDVELFGFKKVAYMIAATHLKN
jgi:hypothetical protein